MMNIVTILTALACLTAIDSCSGGPPGEIQAFGGETVSQRASSVAADLALTEIRKLREPTDRPDDDKFACFNDLGHPFRILAGEDKLSLWERLFPGRVSCKYVSAGTADGSNRHMTCQVPDDDKIFTLTARHYPGNASVTTRLCAQIQYDGKKLADYCVTEQPLSMITRESRQ